MSYRGLLIWFTLSISLSTVVFAQAPAQPQPVQWTGSIAAKTPIGPGSKATIEIAGNVQEGWHVYGLDQISGGPTPLHVSVDANETIQSAGAVKGTAPVKKHDTSFDLETQIYTHSFTLQAPVEVKQHIAAGKRTVSVSIHFQACSDRICLPSRTVHVTVPVEISPGS